MRSYTEITSDLLHGQSGQDVTPCDRQLLNNMKKSNMATISKYIIRQK